MIITNHHQQRTHTQNKHGTQKLINLTEPEILKKVTTSLQFLDIFPCSALNPQRDVNTGRERAKSQTSNRDLEARAWAAMIKLLFSRPLQPTQPPRLVRKKSYQYKNQIGIKTLMRESKTEKGTLYVFWDI